jgi:aconitate hydratase
LLHAPIAKDSDGNPIYLKDIWPTQQEIREMVECCVTPGLFHQRYADVFTGPPQWQSIETITSTTYCWDAKSTYIKPPPFFEKLSMIPQSISNIYGARVLARFGNSVTTDHISPAGNIKQDSPAGSYLIDCKVPLHEFNSYGARRGNHEVMVRGTFANAHIQNELISPQKGGFAKYQPSGEILPIYDVAMRYQDEGIPVIIFAGREYGTGSSRDWAAKGTTLLGIRVVIAESFERIHRSNLVGMGVLPLQLKDNHSCADLAIDGAETFDITGIAAQIEPRMDVVLTIHRVNGISSTIPLTCRIDTLDEVEYFKNGGILQYVLRKYRQKIET